MAATCTHPWPTENNQHCAACGEPWSRVMREQAEAAGIEVLPLFDDERPMLTVGPNYIAHYDGPRGPGEYSAGNTQEQAVAALLARFPRNPAAERAA